MSEIKSRCITLKALLSKEVINTVTGERLGYIDDADIEIESGRIRCFCITSQCRNPFSKKRDVKKFSYEDITKIGGDIILIKSCFDVPKSTKNCCKKS